MVRKMLKIEIAMISSKLEAAIRVVGIPFLVPYFAFYRIMQEGTSTAGLTAPKVYPSAKASAHGRLKIQRHAKADATASAF